MYKQVRLLLVILSLLNIPSISYAQTIRVLQFNIWQEGSIVPGGFDAIVDEIIRLKADLIAFSEVRNYKQTSFNERIVEALAQKGQIYYSFYSYDSGILSKYPIEKYETIFPEQNDQGSLYKALINIKGKQLAFYTAHLDYKHAANYLPRGYHSSTWEKLPKPVLDVKEILADNLASKRDEAIKAFISDALQEINAGKQVILGGDFNEPSHLDWTENSKHLFERKVAVDWSVPLMPAENQFSDAYREKYPNSITHPGITFPVYNPKVDFKKLVWAPESDDRDRIDYIFYYPNPEIKLKKIKMIGPQESIAFGKVIKEKTKDPLILPKGIWPTDHRAIFAIFRLK